VVVGKQLRGRDRTRQPECEHLPQVT
jgi:hypothetical protein